MVSRRRVVSLLETRGCSNRLRQLQFIQSPSGQLAPDPIRTLLENRGRNRFVATRKQKREELRCPDAEISLDQPLPNFFPPLPRVEVFRKVFSDGRGKVWKNSVEEGSMRGDPIGPRRN